MLKDLTAKFYSSFFPPIEDIKRETKAAYETNDIIFKSAMVYGPEGSGKTELIRKFAEVAMEQYGEENVSIFFSEEGNLNDLMMSLDEKLVNIIFADNITMVKMPDSVIIKYFRARNIWQKKFNRRTGLFIGFLGTHRFHAPGSLNLRTNLDAIIWKSAPMNLYDRSVAKQYITEEAVQFLKELDDKKIKDPRYKGINVFNLKSDVGYITTPLAKKNYLQKIDKSISEVMQTLMENMYGEESQDEEEDSQNLETT